MLGSVTLGRSEPSDHCVHALVAISALNSVFWSTENPGQNGPAEQHQAQLPAVPVIN